MKERPILFQQLMVQALMAGIKTETRRIIKNPEWYGCPTGDCPHQTQYECDQAMNDPSVLAECPYGVPGDRLWVRETWWMHDDPNAFGPKVGNVIDHNGVYRIVGYHASMDFDSQRCAAEYGARKRSPIYMPRWASRITLEIVKTWVEQVESITEAGAVAEGFADRAAFLHTFYQINKRAEAGSNPWVRAIKFVPLNLNPAKPE